MLGALLALVPWGSPGAAGSAGPDLALGTVTDRGSVSCAASGQCRDLTVSCPGVTSDVRARVSVARATAPARGLLMFFSGGTGSVFWSEEQGQGAQLLERLRAEGFYVVQVRWGTPWLASSPGERAGPAKLGCRPATVVRWVWEHEYTPLGLKRVPGRCGFCVVGSSGGASQVAYSVTGYKQGDIVDGLFPISGPVHAALERACSKDVRDKDFWYRGAQARRIDMSYGYRGGGGPCERNDAAWTARWRADDADLVGSFTLKDTRVEVIVGGRDTTHAVPHAREYVTRLQTEGSPRVSIVEIAGMGHAIQQSPEGMSALEAALLAGSGGPVSTVAPSLAETSPADTSRAANAPGRTAGSRPARGRRTRPVGPYVALMSVAAVVTTSVLVRRALNDSSGSAMDGKTPPR